jgi:FlgD Ig-like domain
MLLIAATSLGLTASVCDAQSLYWLDTNYGAPTLNKSDASGAGVTSVPLTPGSLPEGLVVDASNRLFWVEAAWSNAKLNRAAPTLASVTPLVSGGSAWRGIAVDDQAQLLYWTSSNGLAGSTIYRSAMNGSGATALVSLAAGANPRGIAVDHSLGKIYWVDFDLSAIYSANLDGSSAGVWFPLSPGCGPYGIGVDQTTHSVYWTEYNSGMLRRIPSNLTSVTNLLTGLANPTYVTVDPPSARVYWIDGGAGAQHIRRVNTNGSGQITLPPPISTYGGIAFFANSNAATPPDELPMEFALDRVWPNPARGSVRVALSFPRDEAARLSVMDLQGREVATLAAGVVPAGRHEWVWNGRCPGGPAPTGIYFVRLAVAGQTWTRRLALTR